jgi:hypothetical protein
MISKNLPQIISKAFEIKDGRETDLEQEDLIEIAQELDIEAKDFKLACQLVSNSAQSLEIKGDIATSTQVFVESSLLNEKGFCTVDKTHMGMDENLAVYKIRYKGAFVLGSPHCIVSFRKLNDTLTQVSWKLHISLFKRILLFIKTILILSVMMGSGLYTNYLVSPVCLLLVPMILWLSKKMEERLESRIKLELYEKILNTKLVSEISQE